MVKLAAAALLDHLPLAGRWEGYRIVLPLSGGIDIAIAVDTPQGLLAPVLRDVCNTPLAELARRSSDLVEQARQGRLAAKEMQGAVFTITNLGGLGIDAFTPIINFPQTAILGLGAIRREAVILESGQIVAGELMTLSLTFDHRVVDGAPSARFLQSLCRAMASMDESSFT
jgi:pyruvate dehydrogenase E2 component (dihydrolipoamide acetyltransferase)